jgi:hypothetical protein
MQNSLLPPVVAIHLPSTVGSTIGSMEFSSGIIKTHIRKQRRLHIHHLAPPSQHSHRTHHIMLPIVFSNQDNLTHMPTTPSISPDQPIPPHHATIQPNHSMQPYNLTSTHSCSYVLILQHSKYIILKPRNYTSEISTPHRVHSRPQTDEPRNQLKYPW